MTRKLKFPYHCLRKVDTECKTADARDNSGGEFATRNRCNNCAAKHRFAPKITFVASSASSNLILSLVVSHVWDHAKLN